MLEQRAGGFRLAVDQRRPRVGRRMPGGHKLAAGAGVGAGQGRSTMALFRSRSPSKPNSRSRSKSHLAQSLTAPQVGGVKRFCQ